MAIRDKIKEIEDALDTMILTKEDDESFGYLKKSVVERIHETEQAADALLGNRRYDLSEELREKMKEIENASSSLLELDDDKVSKEIGMKIREMVREISEATDTLLIDDRTGK